MITTTLKRIKAHSPCEDGWKKLLNHLGKTKADDEPLSFAVILKSNGVEDALWCCRCEPQYAKEWRLFAVWCVRQQAHLLTDQRSKDALDVAERHAHGKATDEELAAAWARTGRRTGRWGRRWGRRMGRRTGRWDAAWDAAGPHGPPHWPPLGPLGTPLGQPLGPPLGPLGARAAAWAAQAKEFLRVVTETRKRSADIKGDKP